MEMKDGSIGIGGCSGEDDTDDSRVEVGGAPSQFPVE